MPQPGKSKSLAVALLAAGASRRFGDADKLAAPFRGTMLGLFTARAIPREAFAKALVIAPGLDHPCTAGWEEAGYAVHANPRAHEGMGTSVALAARLAQAAEVDALLIALADMPLVPSEHYSALARAAGESGPDAIVVSSDGAARMPPAIFGAEHFGRLTGLEGDMGARAILSQGSILDCPPAWLADIDTPEALAALE